MEDSNGAPHVFAVGDVRSGNLKRVASAVGEGSIAVPHIRKWRGAPMHENESPAPFHVVGIAGSLRVGSYNRALLRTAQELQPPLLRIEIQDLADIPLYNEDVERAGAPESVARLRSVVTNADGLLIATPEYNYGVPGVLKNTVDWLSRPRAVERSLFAAHRTYQQGLLYPPSTTTRS